jgi:hypothetical protein
MEEFCQFLQKNAVLSYKFRLFHQWFLAVSPQLGLADPVLSSRKNARHP